MTIVNYIFYLSKHFVQEYEFKWQIRLGQEPGQSQHTKQQTRERERATGRRLKL